MYQISIEELHSPFGGKLDPNNRWVLLHKMIPWMSLESDYAHKFTVKTGSPVKPLQMAFGAVFIQQRLGVKDRGTVEQITPLYPFTAWDGTQGTLIPFSP